MIIIPPTGTAGAGALLAASNLSDLASAATARTNLDVQSKAESSAQVTARAARQALVFNGTGFATFATAIPAPGTGDFTVALWMKPNAAQPSTASRIVGGATNGNECYIEESASLRLYAAATIFTPSPVQTITPDEWQLAVWSRTAGVLSISVNAKTPGTVACTASVTSATVIGADAGSGNYYAGAVAPLFFNRALSQAQILALYQDGAPQAADYHAGLANTTINAGAFVVGRRYRILVVGTTTFTAIGASANTIGIEFIATGVGTGTGTATAIGLMAAPDAGKRGFGPTWFDRSGNSAHLTLPASGVQWNVPGNDETVFNSQTGTAYTLLASDAGLWVRMSNASANTLTIPLNATVPFPIGTTISVEQQGAGLTTVSPTGGVTLVSRGSAFKMGGQAATAVLVKTGTDSWNLSGDIVV